MTGTKLPEGAYAALKGLQGQAAAATASFPGNDEKTVAAGRHALAVAHEQMKANTEWVDKIVKAIMKNKLGLTVVTVDAEWLESTFAEHAVQWPAGEQSTAQDHDLLNTAIIFDPTGGDDAPYTTAVEILLGGVGRLIFPNGTQQFADDDAEPVLIYSPRLPPEALERFCKENMDRYERFNAEHEKQLAECEPVAMQAFW
jgi:hypothetical protein